MLANIAYEMWINSPNFDNEFKKELKLIENNVEEIYDRFYKDLEFGTGGMRGLIGAGRNRINKYTIRRASQAFSLYLKKQYKGFKKITVIVGFDTRQNSWMLAYETAGVLAANGIEVMLFGENRTTPEISHAVRSLGAQAGIMITASHNPSNYNGYKVYNSKGVQLLPNDVENVVSIMKSIKSYVEIKYMEPQAGRLLGRIKDVPVNIETDYLNALIKRSRKHPRNKNLHIVYTPLHGTGLRPVVKLFNSLGYDSYQVIKEESQTVIKKSDQYVSNPEDDRAFERALNKAKESSADIVLATDPDADRVGVYVKDKENSFMRLSGNELGSLMLDYLIKREHVSSEDALITTHVSSNLGVKIAQAHGMKVYQTLTGFKYIGDLAEGFSNHLNTHFFFGYEESCGYLFGDTTRDKDGVFSTVLICEMAAYYKEQGLSLNEVLKNLYETYGYIKDELISFKFKGAKGLQKRDELMNEIRKNENIDVECLTFTKYMDADKGLIKDLLTGEKNRWDVEKSDLIKFVMKDGSWIAVRPSGTEPKLKWYVSINGDSLEDVDQRLNEIKGVIKKVMVH